MKWKDGRGRTETELGREVGNDNRTREGREIGGKGISSMGKDVGNVWGCMRGKKEEEN